MKRIVSIDLLRGFDLFILLALGPVVMALSGALTGSGEGWFAGVTEQFTHVRWEGLRMWDMIMPLFMFTAGLSLPFAMEKYNSRNGRVYGHILKRVAVLWLLGMVVQGGLMTLNWEYVKFFSNTLQAIAVGYLGASVIYLNLRIRWQVALAGALLATYWALMTFAGGGNYDMAVNLPERIDSVVLGRFRDGMMLDGSGAWRQALWYNYAWIMPSLNFIVTVMLGGFAALVIRSDRWKINKALVLVLLGVCELTVGYVWAACGMPIIKTIWTSSMTLVTGGYATLLFAGFYWAFDVRGQTKGLRWLMLYGRNSIAAYVVGEVVMFYSVSQSLFYGFRQYVGPEWFEVVIAAANAACLLLVLYIMKKQGLYLKA